VSAIIDNREQRLALRVRDHLEAGAVGARLAVGYLFLDGLHPLRAQIDRLESLEILIGNVVNRLTEEQVREESAARTRGGEAWIQGREDVTATLRESHDRAAAETALNLRATLAALPRTAENQAVLLTLAGRVAQGNLRVRLYTQGRIHAKVTLVEYPAGHPEAPRLAIVGSSNLTLGGEAHPTELNVVLRDGESVAVLEKWFGQLWDISQDFHRELFDELGQCWAFRPLTADPMLLP
jgi:phosphatidylserine/phosphatidylglycerophosphate/cardiolipin synthase-like enzyme